jgi:hydrogenase/urease accessory protein HupE
MIRRLSIGLVLVLAAFGPGIRAGAHALEPGYLELSPLGTEDYRVIWRRPQINGEPMAIDALLPETCTPRRGPDPAFDGRAFVSGWVARCPGGLAGGEIRVEGLEATRTDVLVRYTTTIGAPPSVARLTAAETAFTVPVAAGSWGIFTGYFALGVDHILSGVDHLLFVFALLLLVRNWRRLIAAVTAFTVAHSISLALATLEVIAVPPPPVEAVIALSIAFLARELAEPAGQDRRLTDRAPWIVAFGFGLLHGLGFARALQEIGLPQGDVPLALLAFNVGVEAGQLLFIGAVIAVGLFLTRLYPSLRGTLAKGTVGLRMLAYGIGVLAMYWVVQRVTGFWA